MKASPLFQLTLVSVLGALGAAGADFGVNGAASGVAKASAWIAASGLDAAVAASLAWVGHAGLGFAAAAYFRPLTRRSAGSLAFGLAAVLSILVPAPG
jgi:hypothetical protein